MTVTALSPAQLRSVARATARVNVWTGSVRSGKTISSLLRWDTYVANPPPGGELVAIGRTRESIARNVFGPLQDPTLFGDMARHVTYTAGAPTAHMFGRTVHVLGASDARAEAVLRGMTCAGAYVDEATLVAEPFWNQLLGRMSVAGAQLFATTNPDGPAHYLKKQVLDRADELGYRIFQFRLTDNTHLDPSYVDQIRREYTGLWRRRFIDGEWVIAEGAIYSMWNPAEHVIPAQSVPTVDRVVGLGIDYGQNHPTRGYLIGLTTEEPARLVVLDEWAPRSMTDAHLSADLRSWLADRPQWTPQWIYVDPAALSLRMQLFGDGFTNVAQASNSVLPGIRTVSSLLATGRLVASARCKHLADRLPGYSWDPKATARGEDKPIKLDDDEADALRYAVYSTRALWRNHIPLTVATDTAPGTDPLLDAA